MKLVFLKQSAQRLSVIFFLDLSVLPDCLTLESTKAEISVLHRTYSKEVELNILATHNVALPAESEAVYCASDLTPSRAAFFAANQTSIETVSHGAKLIPPKTKNLPRAFPVTEFEGSANSGGCSDLKTLGVQCQLGAQPSQPSL